MITPEVFAIVRTGRAGQPVVVCTEDNPLAQQQCRGYRPHPCETWCHYNYDANGRITDLCACPGILQDGAR